MGIPPPGQCVNKFIFLGKKCIMFLTCSTFVQELPFHAWEQTYEDTMLFLATCCSLQICIYSVTLLRHLHKDYHGYGWPAGDFKDTLQGRIRVILCLPFPFLSMPSCVGGALG